MQVYCDNCGRGQDAARAVFRQTTLDGETIAFFGCAYCGYRKVLEQ